MPGSPRVYILHSGEPGNEAMAHALCGWYSLIPRPHVGELGLGLWVVGGEAVKTRGSEGTYKG